MDIKNSLKELGLSDIEAHIYCSLLKLGGSLASAIAKDVGTKRTTVYALLKGLAQKGFVTMYYRKNKQFYYAERPARLAAHFEKKLATFTAMIPMLESFDKKQAQTIGLRFIETKEELKKFYAGILHEYKNKEYYIIGSLHGWEDLDPAFFIRYRKDRGNAHIRTKLLLTNDSRKDNPAEPALRREVRYLPKQYAFKSTIDIYKDKILIVSPELSSLAVVIAIPTMTDIFESVFQMLWENVGMK